MANEEFFEEENFDNENVKETIPDESYENVKLSAEVFRLMDENTKLMDENTALIKALELSNKCLKQHHDEIKGRYQKCPWCGTPFKV